MQTAESEPQSRIIWGLFIVLCRKTFPTGSTCS